MEDIHLATLGAADIRLAMLEAVDTRLEEVVVVTAPVMLAEPCAQTWAVQIEVRLTVEGAPLVEDLTVAVAEAFPLDGKTDCPKENSDQTIVLIFQSEL